MATNIQNNFNLSQYRQVYDTLPPPSFGPDRFSIDSLDIRIPAENCDILMDELNHKWGDHNMGTGLCDDSNPRVKTLYSYGDGYKIGYRMEMMNLDNRKPKNYVIAQITAKALEGRYFEGITHENISNLVTNLMNHKNKVVAFDLDTILKAECTDVDIKSDVIFPGNFIEFINTLEKATRESSRRGRGFDSKTRKDNQMIQWSDRRCKSSISNPFLKFYNKTAELIHDVTSAVFAGRHLRPFDYSNIGRCEFTIKNKKHAQSAFGTKDTSLISLLSLTDEQKRSEMERALSKHVFMDVSTPRRRSNVTFNGIKYTLFKAVSLLHSQGMDYDAIEVYLLAGLDCKTERSRQRKILKEIWGVLDNETVEETPTVGAWIYDIFWKVKRA